MLALDNKIAIVAGASSGIGYATAKLFAQEGAKVIVGARNVRVNAILPGATDTAMYREMNNTPAAREFITGLYPLRRIANAEEIAKSVLYLACDASSFTTGSALLVEGGVSIHRT